MPELTRCPAWLLQQAQSLMQAASQQRLHHALLITGIDGIGKSAFTLWLAQALLCNQRVTTGDRIGACGECAACTQVLAQSHPDFKAVEPEGANAGIKIDSIRELVSWLQLTAGQSSYRVALLSDANGLNRFAANSLLKTLEEPADNAVLILCASRIGALPATVLSRCQKITLKIDDQQAAHQWLADYVDAPEQALIEAGGGPFEVVRQLDEQFILTQNLLLKAWTDLFLHKGSVGRVADSLSKLDSATCLTHFASWCVMAAKNCAEVQFGANAAVALAVTETRDRLAPAQWFTLHERLLELHRTDSASFRTQVVLEGLFSDIRLQVLSG